MSKDTFDIIPFADETVCSSPCCQAVYAKYNRIYEKYIEQLDGLRDLSNENQLLDFDLKSKVAALEHKNNKLQQQYELEVSVVKAFQGDINQDRPLTQGKPTCPNCIGHRQALVNHRECFSNQTKANKQYQDIIEAKIEKFKADVKAQQLMIGKLNIKLSYKNDPFCANKAIIDLRTECAKWKDDYMKLNEKTSTLQLGNETIRQRLVTSEKINDMLQTELCQVRTERDKMLSGQSETNTAPINSVGCVQNINSSYSETACNGSIQDPWQIRNPKRNCSVFDRENSSWP